MALFNLVFCFLFWFPDADAALALGVVRVCGLRFFAGDFVVPVVVVVVVVVVEGNVKTWRRLRTARLFLSNDSTREETMIETKRALFGGNLSYLRLCYMCQKWQSFFVLDVCIGSLPVWEAVVAARGP